MCFRIFHPGVVPSSQVDVELSNFLLTKFPIGDQSGWHHGQQHRFSENRSSRKLYVERMRSDRGRLFSKEFLVSCVPASTKPTSLVFERGEEASRKAHARLAFFEPWLSRDPLVECSSSSSERFPFELPRFPPSRAMQMGQIRSSWLRNGTMLNML